MRKLKLSSLKPIRSADSSLDGENLCRLKLDQPGPVGAEKISGDKEG